MPRDFLIIMGGLFGRPLIFTGSRYETIRTHQESDAGACLIACTLACVLQSRVIDCRPSEKATRCRG
jgi:hypothetical protein